MHIGKIASTIKSSYAPQKPTIIAIDGFGGSGKTTKARELCAALGSAYIVSIDDFIVKDKILEPAWDSGAFDYARLKEQVLVPASKQQPIHYQSLLWDVNKLSGFKEVPSVDYLIIEGISCTHPSIAKYYTYIIWVDTPIDVAKARGQLRDHGNENEDKWDLWAANDLAYQAKYHPEAKADFIISNS
jgi:uridine kinase